MWAQPPAVPPPAHYMPPPMLPAPVPTDPMSFPPGIIPQLVRVGSPIRSLVKFVRLPITATMAWQSGVLHEH